MSYHTIEEAIALQNGVDQGLSSAIMTNSLREAELFLSAAGSDCGIATLTSDWVLKLVVRLVEKEMVEVESLVLMHGKHT